MARRRHGLGKRSLVDGAFIGTTWTTRSMAVRRDRADCRAPTADRVLAALRKPGRRGRGTGLGPVIAAPYRLIRDRAGCRPSGPRRRDPGPRLVRRSAPHARRRSTRAGRGQFREPGRAAATRRVVRPRDLLAEVLVNALNEDPAATGVRELVDDQPLRDRTPYEAVVDANRARARWAGRGGRSGPGRGRRPAEASGAPRRRELPGRQGGAAAARSCFTPARLREPMRRAPGSLAAQLRWVREHWSALVEGDIATTCPARIDLALDVLAEERRA